MKREEKIKYALAFLGPLLFKDEWERVPEPVQITLPSSHSAEIKVGDGESKTVRFGLPFRFHDILRNFSVYNADGEYKNWQECVLDQHEERDYEEVDGSIKYDPELIPDHIYHSIVFCQEMVKNYF